MAASTIMTPNDAAQSAITQDLLDRNQVYSSNSFKPLPTIAEYATILAANPTTPRICIITCCDPRVVPEVIFNLSPGEAIVMRTAGGSVEPALAGMLAIDSLAPLTDVIIMRHTDCGTSHWTDDTVRKALRERSKGEAFIGRRGESVEEMAFCESAGDKDTGDEVLLRQDIEWLKSSPLVREETKRNLVGLVYTTHTGRVRAVC